MQNSVIEPHHTWLHGEERKPWRHSQKSVLLGELAVSERRLREMETNGSVDRKTHFTCDCKNRSVPETLAFLEQYDVGVAETATYVLDNSFAEQRRGFGKKRFVHRTLRELCIGTELAYSEVLRRIDGSADYDLVMPHQVIDMMGLPRGSGGLFRTDEPAEYYYVLMRPININDNGVRRSSILFVTGNGPQLRTTEMNGVVPLDTSFIVGLK